MLLEFMGARIILIVTPNTKYRFLWRKMLRPLLAFLPWILIVITVPVGLLTHSKRDILFGERRGTAWTTLSP